MYRNANDFCIFILYSKIMLNFFTNSNHFGGRVFTIFCIRSYHLQRQFFSSLPILMTFISFTDLNPLTRISSIMLSRSGESRYICLVSDLRKGFQLFIVKYDVRYESVICGLYYVRYITSILN